jgi:hypothetical protein
LFFSGTYNNQYMVLDLGRFRPGEALQPGLLTVVEQVPGLVMWDDATQASALLGPWLQARLSAALWRAGPGTARASPRQHRAAPASS